MKFPYGAIVALDVSLTDTGFVIFEFNGYDYEYRVVHQESIRSNSKDMHDHTRAKYIIGTVMDAVDKAIKVSKVLVVIEGYAFSRSQGKAFTRAEVVGMLKYVFNVERGFDVCVIGPTTLKSFMGDGRAKKEDMARLAKECYGFEHENHNVVDAYCLAQYAFAHFVDLSTSGKAHSRLKFQEYWPAEVVRKKLQAPAKKPLQTALTKISPSRNV